MTLREQYLAAVAASSGKQLISKSAIGPQIYCVRDDAGKVIGFHAGEQLSPEEIAGHLGKTTVSKSAEPEDLNAVFDSLFGVEPKTPAIKSAETDENAVLDSLIPGSLLPCLT